MATLLVLTLFSIYVTWAAFQGENYYANPYLSPLYSPVLYTDPSAVGSAPLAHAWLGAWPSWWPSFLPASPALLILFFPGVFRFTCYYYRKAYYRAFTGSPPACAVNPVTSGTYRGETAWLIFQNLHRYALYFAVAYIFILYYDAFISLFRNGEFGIGVGSVVLFLNATFLGGYTFGCHALRHLVGGGFDCMSCGEETVRYGAWKRVSWLNARHNRFAWMSLVWVGFTDVYVRMVSMGVITDLNTWTN
ncbi:succinate dehydrogenase [Deltaproteobacteria bacterium]|nr:succinate dehydrogenase [Deltaproteobacteria bacterium]